MKTLYVTYNRDLYEVHISCTGEFVSAEVSRNNCGRVFEELEFEEIPVQVFEKLQTGIIEPNNGQ